MGAFTWQVKKGRVPKSHGKIEARTEVGLQLSIWKNMQDVVTTVAQLTVFCGLTTTQKTQEEPSLC